MWSSLNAQDAPAAMVEEAAAVAEAAVAAEVTAACTGAVEAAVAMVAEEDSAVAEAVVEEVAAAGTAARIHEIKEAEGREGNISSFFYFFNHSFLCSTVLYSDKCLKISRKYSVL